MRATYRRVRERLGAGDGLLYRYRGGESPGEGAFGICGFWGAELLALGAGTADEARDLFERLCGHANDVGLFAEQIDPETGEALGNFPQAFTHVGLVNAALSLDRRLRGETPVEHDVAVRAASASAEAVP
jgi:GH15 family glucan-1,4-alpha-glucosidase